MDRFHYTTPLEEASNTKATVTGGVPEEFVKKKNTKTAIVKYPEEVLGGTVPRPQATPGYKAFLFTLDLRPRTRCVLQRHTTKRSWAALKYQLWVRSQGHYVLSLGLPFPHHFFIKRFTDTQVTQLPPMSVLTASPESLITGRKPSIFMTSHSFV